MRPCVLVERFRVWEGDRSNAPSPFWKADAVREDFHPSFELALHRRFNKDASRRMPYLHLACVGRQRSSRSPISCRWVRCTDKLHQIDEDGHSASFSLSRKDWGQYENNRWYVAKKVIRRIRQSSVISETIPIAVRYDRDHPKRVTNEDIRRSNLVSSLFPIIPHLSLLPLSYF